MALRRERRSLYLSLLLLRCRLFSCPRRAAPAKSPSLPALVTAAVGRGSRHPPAPLPVDSGTSLTTSLPSLLQLPPRWLLHLLPFISWATAFMVTSGCREARLPGPIAGGCGRGSFHDKGQQPTFIHPAPCILAPANPLPGVGTPAAPNTLCLLPPPASLALSLPLPCSAYCGWLRDTLGISVPSEGQERNCSTHVVSFPPGRQQIRWYQPLPPSVHQHLVSLFVTWSW